MSVFLAVMEQKHMNNFILKQKYNKVFILRTLRPLISQQVCKYCTGVRTNRIQTFFLSVQMNICP